MGEDRVKDAQAAVFPYTTNALRAGDLRCPVCDDVRTSTFLSAPDRFHWRTRFYSLRQCSSCSYVWLDCPPRPCEMMVHYDEGYHKTIVAGGEGSAGKRWSRARKIVQRYSHGGSLLDIGCSSGGFLSTLKNGPWKLYGVEMEESTAYKARMVSGAEVSVGDVDSAPFAAESFDVITCFDLLEHVYHPREILGSILRWLKHGGILIAQVPNIRSWEARLFGSYWYGLELPRHLSHFSLRSLCHLMRDVGFEEVSLETPPVSYVERSLGFVVAGVIERFGGRPVPQSEMRSRSLASRALRKATRVLAFEPSAHLAALIHLGPSIEGVFRKP